MGVFENKLVFIGDSLTQFGYDARLSGWLAQISHYFIRQYEVINRGYSGYNTRWIQPIVDDVIEDDIAPDADKVQLVTIWFGSNDGAEERSEQHVPLADYKANLIKIINKLRKIPRSSELPLLLVTPPATHGKIWEKVCLEEKGQDNQNRDSENISKYAEVVRQLGAEYNIPVLDFWVEGGIVPEVEDQFVDGLHFSAKGNDIVAKLLIEKLEKEYRHLAIDNEKWKYPHYSTLYGK